MEKPRKRTRAEAARENGRKGGRPRKRLQLQDFAKLGEPPVDVLELFRWFSRVLLLEMERTGDGRSHQTLTEEIRATVAVTRPLQMPVTRAASLKLIDAKAIDGASAAPIEPGRELEAAVWVARRLANHLWRCLTVTGGAPEVKRLSQAGATLRQLSRAWAQSDPPDVAVEAAMRLREQRKARTGGRQPTKVNGARRPLRATHE